MDAAGLTLSLIDLCGRLYKICQTAKNAPEVVKKLVEELVALQLTLESVNHAIAKLQQHPSVLRKIEIEIASCLKDLEELYTEVNTSSKGLRGEIKGWWRKFKWPLKENETREYILQIDRLKTHLVIELQAHHMYNTIHNVLLVLLASTNIIYVGILQRRKLIDRKSNVSNRESRGKPRIWSARNRIWREKSWSNKEKRKPDGSEVRLLIIKIPTSRANLAFIPTR